MTKKSGIILANKLYVPAHLVTNDLLSRWYYQWEDTVYEHMLDNSGMPEVDHKGDPVVQRIQVARSLRTYKETFDKKGQPYIALPKGNFKKLTPFLKLGYQDLRPISPLPTRIHMQEKTLKDHRWADQARVAMTYVNTGSGIIEGDTGSGKTVIGTAITSRLNVTTLIISSRRRGNEQWEEEIRFHTDINEVEKTSGQKLLGVYSGGKRQIFPITIATVQSLYQDKGKQTLANYRSYFSQIIIDEVHEFGAPEFSRPISYMNTRFILGLTATPQRKDGRHLHIFDMVGPIIAKGTAKQMPPKVTLIYTNFTAPPKIYQGNYPSHWQWNKVLSLLSADDERYRIIMHYLISDLDAGRTIAIISDRRIFVSRIYQRLIEAGYNVAYVDGKVPPKKRKIIFDDFKAGKYKAICSGKVMDAMVNLPTLDCLHLPCPVNSRPRVKQLIGRARRWMEEKQEPLIRDYIDAGGQLDGAAKNRQKLYAEEGWEVQTINTNNLPAIEPIWTPTPNTEQPSQENKANQLIFNRFIKDGGMI